jgi:hypothetical protein
MRSVIVLGERGRANERDHDAGREGKECVFHSCGSFQISSFVNDSGEQCQPDKCA